MPHPGFQLAAAYTFAESHGLATEAARIRSMQIHPSIGRPAAVRKGNFVKLFEQHHVAEDFAASHWPRRNSTAGEGRRTYFLEMADLNERALRGEPIAGPAVINSGPSDPDEAGVFALEAHLRDYIAANIARLPSSKGPLVLYKDASGRGGVEYPTAVGPIDILASDSQGNFVVFELKVHRGPDKALGQLARYMGWVKVALAFDKTVTGIIVANSIDDKLRYAAAVVPNVHLLEYELAFTIRPVAAASAETISSAPAGI